MQAQVILAFANDTDESLKCLDHEKDIVYEYLNRMDKSMVNPVMIPDVTIDKIFNEFQARKDKIAVFHFSGHAGQLDLMFNQGKLVSGTGVAELIKLAPNIELVFLNGCATKDLINSFHTAGVKTVIATSKKVYDNVAAEFSIKFYSSLSQFFNVGDAFDYAKSYMVTSKNEDLNAKKNSRHISTSILDENNDAEFPYGIYYKASATGAEKPSNDLQEYEKFDKWQFEDSVEIPVPYNPCIELLKCIGEKGRVLVDYLRKANPNAVKEIKEFADLNNVTKEFVEAGQDASKSGPLSEKVIGLLPRPLGIIMRQMVSTSMDLPKNPAHYNRELLKYQLHFYDVMLKLSCFTMLSDLYEVIQKRRIENKELFFDKKTHRQIMKLLSMEKDDVIDFNYRELIKNMRQKIIDNDGLPFVKEYMGYKDAYSVNDLEIAHEIIKIKKLQYASDKLKNVSISHCKAVEDELCNIFSEGYFILRYNILVIRNIEAIRERFKSNRTFQHRIMLLRVSQSSIYSEYDITNEGDCTENYSVIMVKGLNSIIDYLSLSPFVIDKCVLTNDESSQLLYYSHSNNGALVYEGVEDAREKIEIEIKIKEKEDKLDDYGVPVLVKVKSVPYVDELAKKDIKLNRVEVTKRLIMIHEQFGYFKEAMNGLKYTVK